MHFKAVVGVIDDLDLDARLWAQMVDLGVANSRIKARLCAYSGRPSLEVIAVVTFAVITLPSLMRILLKMSTPQVAIANSENFWTC